MPIIVGIDGTGDQGTYDKDFEDSFVSKICKKLNRGFNVQYNRGPNIVGGGLSSAVDSGYNFIVNRRRIGINEPVLLTGFSRGATGAVVIAKKLQRVGIDVEALMLFDCVDRQLNMDAAVIPENVWNVCHVMRNPRAKSRMTFSNDGLTLAGSLTPNGAAPGAKKRSFDSTDKFFCTHGAMGGTYWKPEKGQKMHDFVDEGFAENAAAIFRGRFFNTTNVTFREDELVSKEVWQYVQKFLTDHKFIK